MSTSGADNGKSLPPVKVSTEILRGILDRIDAADRSEDRAALAATQLQPMVGYLLRDLIQEARQSGVTWMKVGEVTETSYTALCRQFYGSGPMLSAASRAHHRKAEQ